MRCDSARCEELTAGVASTVMVLGLPRWLMRAPPLLLLATGLSLITKWQDVKQIAQLSFVIVTGRGGEQAHSIDTYATRPRLQNAVTTVPCQPLGALLGTHSLSRVHLLVLDVEGSEWIAIQTVDVSVFSIILVELDGTNKTKFAQKERSPGCSTIRGA